MHRAAAFATGLVFLVLAVGGIVLAAIERDGVGTTRWEIEVCHRSPELMRELCTRMDDWKSWMRRWDYFPLVHGTNALTAFFLLALRVRTPDRAYSTLFTALVVFFLGWVMELFEEVSFIAINDPDSAQPTGIKSEYEPPDSVVGDPVAHIAGVAIGVALSHITHMVHPLRAERPTWRWLVALGETAAFVYVSALSISWFFTLPDGVQATELFYSWRRVARPDWLSWTLFRLGGIALLWLAHTLLGDARRGVWGATPRAFHRVWFAFFVTNAIIHLLVMWVWTRQVFLVMWLIPAMLGLLLVGGTTLHYFAELRLANSQTI